MVFFFSLMKHKSQEENVLSTTMFGLKIPENKRNKVQVRLNRRLNTNTREVFQFVGVFSFFLVTGILFSFITFRPIRGLLQDEGKKVKITGMIQVPMER